MKKYNRKQIGGIVKGVPSAFVISIFIHIGFACFAVGIIVFVVSPNPPVEFNAPPPVQMPKIPLEKIMVPVKSPKKPKNMKRIRAVIDDIAFQSISFPNLREGELKVGMNLAGDDVDYIEVSPFENAGVFGFKESTGNDFSGRLYDLKRQRNGRFNYIRGEETQRGVPDTFRTEIYHYVEKGWDDRKIAKYYRSEKRYTPHFCFPAIPASMAADQFGVPETEGYYFFMKYTGQLVFSRDITFRFWCSANSFGMVQVAGKEVLVAGWEMHVKFFDWWESSESVWKTQYILSDRWMAPSDWITLKAGVPVPMKVLIGNRGHNAVTFILLVEEKGRKYPTRSIGGPLLPLFRTEELSEDMLDRIMNFLPEGEADLLSGPIFRDF